MNRRSTLEPLVEEYASDIALAFQQDPDLLERAMANLRCGSSCAAILHFLFRRHWTCRRVAEWLSEGLLAQALEGLNVAPTASELQLADSLADVTATFLLLQSLRVAKDVLAMLR